MRRGLSRVQIGILYEIKERAKKGNVILGVKQLKEARRLLLLNVAKTSFPIYRLLLKTY